MKGSVGKGGAKPSGEVVEILAGCGAETREMMLETRAAILKMFPALIESADVKSRVIGYGYGAKYADMICSMMPAKGWVTLGIAYAAAFPDPQKILEGTGKVHRHVKIRNKADLESAGLKAILKLSNEGALARGVKQGKKGEK
jgi:hypothetical protein